MGKRIFLLVAVNILVMITITTVLSLLGAANYMPQGRIASLAVFCLVWGFAGAFISLGLSRIMAKLMMRVRVIPPETNDSGLRQLVDTVHALARQAGLPVMPQVGIYDSPDVNAFATGPTRARALVAVSTGLLGRMRQGEVSGVLAHEVAHIANGDMVTMTLVQGVINAFALFLSRILAFVIGQALRSRDDRGGGGMIEFLLSQVFYIVFSILGAIVVCWFSRVREYRADAGGASLAGRENMIGALRALQRLHNPEAAAADAHHNQAFQSFKISGARVGIYALFSSHPPLEQRIARLQQGV
ncbi:MAG TPA: protease HtpX [Clostridia bacterium]|nr:protease HtpX [Clostridia bacterium]